MRYLRLLTAIAVLACSALAQADNLPPAPKSEIKVVTDQPTPAPAKETVTIALSPVPDKATASIEEADAPLPPPCKTCSSSKSSKSEGEKFKSALKDAGRQLDDQACTCKHVTKSSIQFVANQFLCKPIYGLEKANNDAEGRRLCREYNRLNDEAECLAARSEKLAEKIKNANPDLKAKFKLLKEQADYAADANRNAVERAKLELKMSEYCQKKNHLEKIHDILYPAHD